MYTYEKIIKKLEQHNKNYIIGDVDYISIPFIIEGKECHLIIGGLLARDELAGIYWDYGTNKEWIDEYIENFDDLLQILDDILNNHQ